MLQFVFLALLCLGVLAAPAATLRLRHAQIDTAPAVQAFARTRNPRDKIAAAPASPQMLTRRGTRPYLMQFTGPVQEAWKEEIYKLQLTIDNYIPDNAFIVQCAPADLEKLAALDCVQWLGEYRPEYKRDTLKVEPGTWREITIQTFTPADTNEVAARVQALGGSVLTAGGAHKGIVWARVPGAALTALTAMAEIEWIEPHTTPTLCLDIATQPRRMNVQSAWVDHGLTGTGQVIAFLDTGLDSGKDDASMHPDFRGRVKYGYGWARANKADWSDEYAHGTHCAGDALGSGAAANGRFRGPAYQAQIVVQCNFDILMDGGVVTGFYQYFPADLTDFFVQAYTNGARIHSHSWGDMVNGAYTAYSRQCDEFMWLHPDLLLVCAAGNEGVDENANSVTDLGSLDAPASAKNVLTMGAAENLRPDDAQTYWWFPASPIKVDRCAVPYDGLHQGMAAWSSRGPCQDGRTKPDLVAPGTSIIAPLSHMPGASDGLDLYNANYCYMSGTSMSTPLAAGCAALVRQYLTERRGITNPSAAAVKALLVNGARSLAPGQYGTGAYREVPSGARPNNVEGWGQLNLTESLFPPAGSTVMVHDTYALNTGATNTFQFVAPGATKLCVTLAWTDYPSALAAGVNLVNDLDLRISTPGGATLHPNGRTQPDRLNNMEGIDIATTAAGTYTIMVNGYNVPQGPQPYALVLRNATAPTLGNVPATLALEAPLDGTDAATVVITNTGTGPLTYTFSIAPFNYTARKSTDTNGPAFAWVDIAASGTPLTLSDDQVSGLIPFGFSFPFYGSNYTKFAVAANGAVTLATGAVGAVNVALPTTTVLPPFIAGFWDDLNPNLGGSIAVLRSNDHVIVSWLAVPRGKLPSQTETFQILLYASGKIVYQYKTMNGTINSATIGLQQFTNGPALQLTYGKTYVQNNLAVHLTPPAWLPWLSITPGAGRVPARGSALPLFAANAIGVQTGRYTATVALTHDDFAQFDKTLVVTLDVVPEPLLSALLAFSLLWTNRMRNIC